MNDLIPSNITRRPVIGLFGAYWINNFGDDLMALIFAKNLRKLGYEVLIFGLNNYENPYGAQVEKKFDSFLESIDCLIIGGGGFLVPKKLTSSYDLDMDKKSQKLAATVKHKRIPCFAVSVGGNGSLAVEKEDLPKGWRELLGSCNAISVRNEKDLPLANKFCQDVEFNDDVVWLSKTLLTNQSGNSYRDYGQLLVNLSGKGRRGKIFGFLIQSCSPFYNLKFIEISTDLSRKKNCSTPGEPVEEILHKLINADLIISTKLHIGLASLAMGGRFVSVLGPPKVQALLRSLNADYFGGSVFENLRFITYLISKKVLDLNVPEWVVEQRIEAATKNIDFLAQRLKQNFL